MPSAPVRFPQTNLSIPPRFATNPLTFHHKKCPYRPALPKASSISPAISVRTAQICQHSAPIIPKSPNKADCTALICQKAKIPLQPLTSQFLPRRRLPPQGVKYNSRDSAGYRRYRALNPNVGCSASWCRINPNERTAVAWLPQRFTLSLLMPPSFRVKVAGQKSNESTTLRTESDHFAQNHPGALGPLAVSFFTSAFCSLDKAYQK